MMPIAQLAQAAHEMNKIYCESLGDSSQVHWEHAPGWQKESAINGVLAIFTNPDTSPGESHENWLADKTAAGWKWGPVKNPETKEHPCFMPFAQLPPEQQFKDVLFIEVVQLLMNAP